MVRVCPSNFLHVGAKGRESKGFNGNCRAVAGNILLVLCSVMWESHKVNSLTTGLCLLYGSPQGYVGWIFSTFRRLRVAAVCEVWGGHIIDFIFLGEKVNRIIHLHTLAWVGPQDSCIKAQGDWEAEDTSVFNLPVKRQFNSLLCNCFFRKILYFSMHLWLCFQLF